MLVSSLVGQTFDIWGEGVVGVICSMQHYCYVAEMLQELYFVLLQERF